MSQVRLQKTQADPVGEASAWARFLVEKQGRGERAIAAVARKAGVPKSRVWSLLYRPETLKDIGAKIYLALRSAYEAEVERQMKALRHELIITRAKAGAHHPAVVAAEALVGEAPRIDPDDRPGGAHKAIDSHVAGGPAPSSTSAERPGGVHRRVGGHTRHGPAPT